MLKKSFMLILIVSLGLLFCGGAIALEAQTVGPLSFYATEGDLEVVVKASHPGNATGKQPSVEWESCSEPEDGSHLVWMDPSPQKTWEISEVTVSAKNGADLFKYDGSWGEVDNPSIFEDFPMDCFKAGGDIPGDDDDDDDDDLVNSWEVQVGACSPCPPFPEADIIPVENPCSEDYWTFTFDVESCDNVCSLDVTFYLECDPCGETEYGIWKLVVEGDYCNPCEWEFIGGDFGKVNVGDECSPDYECILGWELTSVDYDFCCGFEDTIFGIGPIPEEGPDFSDEGVITVGEEPDQYIVGWTLDLEKCEDSPDISGTVVFEPLNPDPDYEGDGEAFFFSLDLENPDNICLLDLCLYGQGEDGVCSIEDEKSLYWFQEAISEWTELEVTYEIGDYNVDGETFCERLCVHFPQGGITPEDLDEFLVVFGVDDGETDIFIEPEPEPGGDEPPKKSGGGGCNIGSSLWALLLMIPVGWLLCMKR